MKSVLGLVDCRAFYVSVERVWDSSLKGRPVLVLGNNDSAIVALSEEAKQLGLRRGMPFFECRELIEKYQIPWFSSNYATYGNFSARVGQILEPFAQEVEPYSIDEWFLRVPPVPDLVEYGQRLRQTILQQVGLPVGVSFAYTKTQTKIGGEIVKKYPEHMGVLAIVDIPEKELDEWLSRISVDDVWMIGPQKAIQLNGYGIFTAKQLRDADLAWIHRRFTVVTARTVLELRGIPCIPLEPVPKPKKSIASAKSFGRPVEHVDQLRQAIATYMARASEKLRAQGSVAGCVSVFIMTNRWSERAPQYSNSASRQLLIPTSFAPDLIAAATDALVSLYRPGYQYVKAGVFLSRISATDYIQPDLFGAYNPEQYTRKDRLMTAIDALNRLFGPDTIFLGSMGLPGERTWQMRQSHLSRHYTTRWQEILEVSAKE